MDSNARTARWGTTTTQQKHELQQDSEDRRRQIEQRAYELYEQRGRQDGFALQDWLQAKLELAENSSREQFLVKEVGHPGSPL